MTYANVVFSYGAARFLSLCRDVGIDGLILPDLPSCLLSLRFGLPLQDCRLCK